MVPSDFVRSQKYGDALTFPPISPNELLQCVYADIVRVHLFNLDIALLQVLPIDLIRMASARRQQQHDNNHRAIGVVWDGSRSVRRRANCFGLAAV